MHVTVRGATFVRAEREAVWAALHDTEVIARCIPGCRALARASDSLFVLSTRIRIGPLRLVVDGTVELRDCDPPHSYSLVGQGRGGALSANGMLRVTLLEQRGGCRLCYAIEADARGPIAGAALASGIGRGMSAYFASRLGERIVEQVGEQQGERIGER